MICPRCRAENGPGSRFCGQCGAALPVACPACGAANPPDNRFCGQCASPLRTPAPSEQTGAVAGPAQPSASGEFRQVTVLFCDIVNSTGLAERLGDETLHELLRRFLDAAIAEVFRYGGSVPQFTGDGFMALFGAPVAHEDHVRRALLAAVAILQTVESGAEAPSNRQSPGLAIRIGINSGLVVFGAVSDSVRMDSTAIGDTANVAARLQAEAEPNGIVISEATYRLAGGYARVEPIGTLQLKGRQEPITAFRLIDVSSRPHAATDPAAFGSRVFVGRGRELAALDELLHRAEQGSGQAVGIQGEPGIGKSRLLSELGRIAGQRCTWIEGRCVSYGTVIPYLLALDLLRSACGILDRDRPAEIEVKLRGGLRAAAMDPDADAPLLIALLGGGEASEAQHGNRPAVKARAFAILRQFAINTSRNGPLVLAIEDAHWIDALSQEFLDLLAESLPGARILLVATYRPGYRPGWIGKSYAAQLALQPLTREDSRQVLDAVLNRRRLSDRLAGTLLARAEGNPFFLEQLALNLGEEAEAPAQSVPATIRDVVTARIDRLAAPTRRLLQIAAVVGREFSLPLIRKVWQGPEAPEPLLRELLQLEFLYERLDSEETAYVFRHALTQDAAYIGLLARDRRHTHAAVGAALETLFRGRTEEVAELLALHYDRSNESEKAVDYAIFAAEKAQRRWANAEALAYFDTALRRLDAMPDSKPNRLRRIDAVIKQAEVKFALGHQTEHIAALDAIRATVEESGEPRYRATWHYWRGFLHSLTDGAPAVAIEHCRQAAQIAADAGFEELDGFVASALAQAYVVAGEPRAAIDVGEKAVRVFEARGNVWWSGRTLGHLANAAVILGEWRRSLEYCQLVMECGNRLADLRLKAIGWYRMGFAHIQQGDIETGLRCCDEALSLKPTPYDVFLANGYRGYGEIKLGRVNPGIARLESAIAWLRSTRQRYTELRFATWLAEAYLRRGDREKAMPLIQSVLGGSETNGYRYLAGVGHWLKGVAQAAELPEAAARSVDEAIGILGAIGAQNDLARAMMTRAALWEHSSHTEKAREARQQAERVLQALGTRPESDWFGPQFGRR